MIIIGTHTLIYTTNAEADRAFLRDVLGFSYIDAGGGWLIFALPPAETGVHPAADNNRHEIMFMTDNVNAEIARLTRAGSACEPIVEQSYGSVTAFTLPGGGKIGLYQPKHELAIKG